MDRPLSGAPCALLLSLASLCSPPGPMGAQRVRVHFASAPTISSGGYGGGGAPLAALAAAARTRHLRWWRRRPLHGVKVAAEKEVAVKVGRLDKAACHQRAPRGERDHPTRLHRVAVEEILAPPTGHILGSFRKALMRM